MIQEEATLFADDVLVLIGTIFALIFVFLCICVVCDQHLVPAVETVIDEFDVPEEIAAVTLIAFGSSSPEIMLNTVSAYQGTGALSMPAMLGSAIIAFGLIPPLCILGTSEESVDLETRPILRETFCFTMGLCFFTKIVADGSTNLTESLLILSLYVLYVVIIIITYYCYKTSDHVPQQHHHHSDNSSVLDDETTPLIELTSMGLINETNNSNNNVIESKKSVDGLSLDMENDDTKRNWLEKCCHRLFNCASYPLEVLFDFIIPALHDAPLCTDAAVTSRNEYSSRVELRYGHGPYCCYSHKVTLFRSLTVVATCIMYVCIFAAIVVKLCGLITEHIGLDQTTIGATLVAFGAQLPDVVSSISLARGGYFNGAMANAIGSQVINITLGVGLPASILCLSSKTRTFEIVKQSDDSIKFLVGLSFIVILGYCLFTMPLMSFMRSGKVMNSTCINRKGAYGLLLLFITIMGVYITFND